MGSHTEATSYLVSLIVLICFLWVMYLTTNLNIYEYKDLLFIIFQWDHIMVKF